VIDSFSFSRDDLPRERKGLQELHQKACLISGFSTSQLGNGAKLAFVSINTLLLWRIGIGLFKLRIPRSLLRKFGCRTGSDSSRVSFQTSLCFLFQGTRPPSVYIRRTGHLLLKFPDSLAFSSSSLSSSSTCLDTQTHVVTTVTPGTVQHPSREHSQATL
jgi:hypothetical protein